MISRVSISEEVIEVLARLFTEEEVTHVLFSMEPTKAPGLDGFHAFFFFGKSSGQWLALE